MDLCLSAMFVIVDDNIPIRLSFEIFVTTALLVRPRQKCHLHRLFIYLFRVQTRKQEFYNHTRSTLRSINREPIVSNSNNISYSTVITSLVITSVTRIINMYAI